MRATGAFFSETGSQIFDGAAGVGAFFSETGSQIFDGAAGYSIVDQNDSDPAFFMPDHTVSGTGRTNSMYRNAGPGPLRAFKDGSLGHYGRLQAFQDGSLGHHGGMLMAYKDGSLGNCTSCAGPGPLHAYRDGSLGEYFATNGLGEYFATNGLGEYFAANGLGSDGAAPANPEFTQATQAAADVAKTGLIVAGVVGLAVVGGLYLLFKKK